MSKATPSTSNDPERHRPLRRAGLQPNPHAARLADKRWWVTLDPDLVDLLSGDGDPAARLFAFARPSSRKRSRHVYTIPLSDAQYRGLKTILARIGASVRFVPPHPSTRMRTSSTRARRKAG